MVLAQQGDNFLKNRSKSEVEHLRGRIRELEKINRQLKKELRQYTKREGLYDIAREEIENWLEEPVPKPKTCQECGKGTLSTFEIAGRVFEQCNICDYRKKIGG